MPGKLVSKFAFTWMNPFSVFSFNREASEGFCCPMAFTTWSAARRNPDPATGCGDGRPETSAGPKLIRKHSSEFTAPFSAWTRTGCVKKQKLTPSRLMKSYSWAYAVISFSVRVHAENGAVNSLECLRMSLGPADVSG